MLRLAFVSVVGTPLAALGWWLPGVIRVAQLALREFVEPFLLSPEDFELVLAFLCVHVDGVEAGRLGWCIAA